MYDAAVPDAAGDDVDSLQGEPSARLNTFVVNQSNDSSQLVDSFANAPVGTTPQAGLDNDSGSSPVGATSDLSTVVFTDSQR